MNTFNASKRKSTYKQKPFTVAGQDKTGDILGREYAGEWMVKHPSGNLCNGTWKTEEDAQKSCDQWNNRKSSWEVSA